MLASVESQKNLEKSEIRQQKLKSKTSKMDSLSSLSVVDWNFCLLTVGMHRIASTILRSK